MQDLLLDINMELDIKNGDFVTGESTEQNQKLLLLTNKGEWKQNPLVGIGVESFLKDDDAAGLLAEIKAQFEKDGMEVHNINFENGNLNIDATY